MSYAKRGGKLTMLVKNIPKNRASTTAWTPGFAINGAYTFCIKTNPHCWSIYYLFYLWVPNWIPNYILVAFNAGIQSLNEICPKYKYQMHIKEFSNLEVFKHTCMKRPSNPGSVYSPFAMFASGHTQQRNQHNDILFFHAFSIDY